jgi:hypothetical protein
MCVVVYALVCACGLTLYSIFNAAGSFEIEARAKLRLAWLTPLLVVAAVGTDRTAVSAMVGLGLAALFVVVRLLRRSSSATSWQVAGPPLRLFAAGVPFALMGVATLASYRAGTLFLGAWSSPEQTAAYTLAAAIGFGVLALPSAVTAGVVPRLAREFDVDARRAIARDTARWTSMLCVLTALALCAFARYGVVPAFGEEYESASAALVVLAASLVVVGLSTVVATVLIADRRVAPIATQVGLALPVNLLACVVLIPPLGALGAALATFTTELFTLGFLTVVAQDALGISLPRPFDAVRRLEPLHIRVLGLVLGLLALEAWAARSTYALKVVADAPTYLALLPRIGTDSLTSVSTFLPSGGADVHASPYTQGLAAIWSSVRGDDPSASELSRFLTYCGIASTIAVLHALFVWTRKQAGVRAAWLAIPVLLVLLGPLNSTAAGDLSFQGLIRGAYAAEVLALGLLLYTLVVLDGPRGVTRTVVGTLLVAATLLVQPAVGILLCGLVLAHSAWLALRRQPAWERGSLCIAAGFALTLAWPSYSIVSAIMDEGVPPYAALVVCILVPAAVRALPAARTRGTRLGEALVAPFSRTNVQQGLVWTGVVAAFTLATWQVWLLIRPDGPERIWSTGVPAPLADANASTLAMLAVGAIGLAGVARIARQGFVLPVVWLSGCLAVVVAGLVESDLPVSTELVLSCQIPVAVGLAVWLDRTGLWEARSTMIALLVGVAVFKGATMVYASSEQSLSGMQLRRSQALAHAIPTFPGVVATDPFTSYLVPGATGHHVIAVDPRHAGSRRELRGAQRGYFLLHRLATGRHWQETAQQLYRGGVRYLVIERTTSLRPPTLELFSNGPAPLVRTPNDRRILAVYRRRAEAIGHVVYRNAPFTVYVFDKNAIFGAADAT